VSGLVDLAPVLVAVWLLLVGLYGAATTRDLLHLVLSVAVLHSAAWLLLIGIGHREGVTAPVVEEGVAPGAPGAAPGGEAIAFADPLVQALTVTDVVVGVAVSALLLACVVRIHRRFGTVDPDELDVLRG
jgi:multicomponent Na+:H+ antiporter subunit C